MQFRYDRWMLPLTVPLGLGPKASTVAISGPDLNVKMGWAFDATIPLASVTSAKPSTRRVFGWGVHGSPRRGWLVNGSSRGLVELIIEPPVTAKAVRMEIQLSKLTVSVDDPDALIGACHRAT
jgi:hypothetical protein